MKWQAVLDLGQQCVAHTFGEGSWASAFINGCHTGLVDSIVAAIKLLLAGG